MATTKNLCAQIPIDLHERVSEERERLGQTTSEYIVNLIQDYYNMMENQKGGIQMTEKGRTSSSGRSSKRSRWRMRKPSTSTSETRMWCWNRK